MTSTRTATSTINKMVKAYEDREHKREERRSQRKIAKAVLKQLTKLGAALPVTSTRHTTSSSEDSESTSGSDEELMTNKEWKKREKKRHRREKEALTLNPATVPPTPQLPEQTLQALTAQLASPTSRSALSGYLDNASKSGDASIEDQTFTLTAKQIKEMKLLLATPQPSPTKQQPPRAAKTPKANPLGSTLFQIMQALPENSPAPKVTWQACLENIREDLTVLNDRSALKTLKLANIPDEAMDNLNEPIQRAVQTTFKARSASTALDSLFDTFGLKITKSGKAENLKQILRYFLTFQTKKLHKPDLPAVNLSRHLGIDD